MSEIDVAVRGEGEQLARGAPPLPRQVLAEGADGTAGALGAREKSVLTGDSGRAMGLGEQAGVAALRRMRAEGEEQHRDRKRRGEGGHAAVLCSSCA